MYHTEKAKKGKVRIDRSLVLYNLIEWKVHFLSR